MSAVIESTVEPTVTKPRSQRGDPVWEIAQLYPTQGNWTEDAYLALDTNRLIEFKNGVLEFLPMPTTAHARIAKFLLYALDAFVQAAGLGEAFLAPLRTRTIENAIREPDVLFVKPTHVIDPYAPATGASLVMEVVSPGRENRKRDLEGKREEYAEAGIPEYWIVDPQQQTITVLTLADDSYQEHGIFRQGETATSVLIEGFAVDVTACFAAAETLNDEEDAR